MWESFLDMFFWRLSKWGRWKLGKDEKIWSTLQSSEVFFSPSISAIYWKKTAWWRLELFWYSLRLEFRNKNPLGKTVLNFLWKNNVNFTYNCLIFIMIDQYICPIAIPILCYDVIRREFALTKVNNGVFQIFIAYL